jgi:hypothetical protein
MRRRRTTPRDGAPGRHLERCRAPHEQDRHGAAEQHGRERIDDHVRREAGERDRERPDDARHHAL